MVRMAYWRPCSIACSSEEEMYLSLISRQNTNHSWFNGNMNGEGPSSIGIVGSSNGGNGGIGGNGGSFFGRYPQSNWQRSNFYSPNNSSSNFNAAASATILNVYHAMEVHTHLQNNAFFVFFLFSLLYTLIYTIHPLFPSIDPSPSQKEKKMYIREAEEDQKEGAEEEEEAKEPILPITYYLYLLTYLLTYLAILLYIIFHYYSLFLFSIFFFVHFHPLFISIYDCTFRIAFFYFLSLLPPLLYFINIFLKIFQNNIQFSGIYSTLSYLLCLGPSLFIYLLYFIHNQVYILVILNTVSTQTNCRNYNNNNNHVISLTH
ncbi:hypothetical protein F4703DRAFT_1258118 [Phycomyces blakesleeanus]